MSSPLLEALLGLLAQWQGVFRQQRSFERSIRNRLTNHTGGAAREFRDFENKLDSSRPGARGELTDPIDREVG
jgi:hypothetical protein